jgi:hypothetical protein
MRGNLERGKETEMATTNQMARHRAKEAFKTFQYTGHKAERLFCTDAGYVWKDENGLIVFMTPRGSVYYVVANNVLVTIAHDWQQVANKLPQAG